MGKFSDKPKVKEPEPLPPPVQAEGDAEAEARRKAASERKRAGRRATILADVTEEDITGALLGRPGGATTRAPRG